MFAQVDATKYAHRMLPSRKNPKLFRPSLANIVKEQKKEKTIY